MSSFEERVAERRRNFKKGIDGDDARRIREDDAIQLRKADKEMQMSKKRMDESSALLNNENMNNSSSIRPKDTENLKLLEDLVSKYSLPDLVSEVRNRNDHLMQFVAVKRIRQHLSVEKTPPIGEVINSGVIPDFIQLLSCEDRPDIQFEAAWALTNIASGTADQTRIVIEQGAIPIFVTLLRSPHDDVREQAIWALGNIAGDSAKCRDLVLQANAVQPIIEQVNPQKNKLSMIRNAAWTISNLCRNKPAPDLNVVKPLLPVIGYLLQIGETDKETLTDACWALSYFSEGCSDRVQLVIESSLLPRIVALTSHDEQVIQTPALRILGNIVSGNDNQTELAIRCGALQALLKLLNHPKKNIRKEACWSISNIAAGSKLQIQEIIQCGLIRPVLEILSNGEPEVKKEALWAVNNICNNGTEDQIRTIVNEGCMKPICELLDSRDRQHKVMALECIKCLVKVGQSLGIKNGNQENPYCQLIEECDGLDLLEKCQNDENDIYKMAQEILVYFPLEDDIADVENMNIGFESSEKQHFNFGSAAAM